MRTMIASYISFAIVFYVFFLIGAVLFLILLNKWEIVGFLSVLQIAIAIEIILVMINGTFYFQSA